MISVALEESEPGWRKIVQKTGATVLVERLPSREQLVPGNVTKADLVGTDVNVQLPHEVLLEYCSNKCFLALSAAENVDEPFSDGGQVVALQTDGVNFSAPLVSVHIHDGTDFVTVASAENGIRIALMNRRADAPRAVCQYWSLENSQWSGEGVGTVTSDGSLVCITDHLSIFSAIVPPPTCKNDWVDVLSAGGGPLYLTNSGWATGPAAALLWTLTLSVLCLASYGHRLDTRAKKDKLWYDSKVAFNFFEEANELRSTKKKGAYLGGACSNRGRKDLLVGAIRVALTKGTQGILSVKSGVACGALDDHIWGQEGWILKSVLQSRLSSKLRVHFDVVRNQVPHCFAQFEKTGMQRRFWVIANAVHPIAQVFYLDPSAGRIFRTMLVADTLLGALSIACCVSLVSGLVLGPGNLPECFGDDWSPIPFVCVGVGSACFVEVLFSMFRSPKTYVGSLRRCTVLRTWSYKFSWTVFCVIYLLIFVSKLPDVECNKWIVVYVSVLVQSLVVAPCVKSLFLAVVADVAVQLYPQTVRGVENDLGMSAKSSGTSAKAIEMSNRSVSLVDLLDFWEWKLGVQKMVHFQPGASTTDDVVRQAVVPLTYFSGFYAILGGDDDIGVSKRPSRVVVHHWGNDFAQLMAAVCADAVGCKACDSMFDLLVDNENNGLDLLKQIVKPVIHYRYWIDVFCVNQHLCICADPPATDSHGKVILKCRCKRNKIWAGDLCEANKFIDIYAYLQECVPDLMQVVVSDGNCNAFKRLWCQMEIVQARRLGIPAVLQERPSKWVPGSTGKLSLDMRVAITTVHHDSLYLSSVEANPDVFNSELRAALLDPTCGLLAGSTAMKSLRSNPSSPRSTRTVSAAISSRTGDWQFSSL